MAAINGAAARLKDTGRTRPVISASTMVAPSRWRAVSPLGLRRHGPNGSKPVTSTFIKTSHCKTVYLFERKTPSFSYGDRSESLFGAWAAGECFHFCPARKEEKSSTLTTE